MSQPLVRTMSSQLLTLIRERILSGEYPPGTQLLQDAIAAEFGSSKIPVREALLQLCSDGLVNFYAHRGFQVRAISMEEMQEIFRLRLEIEPVAVALGAKIASDEDRAAASAALAAETKALLAKELKSTGDLNAAFHLALIAPRLQPVTHQILQRLYTLSQRYVRMHLQQSGRPKQSIQEHAALHEAWSKGAAKEAQRLVQEHIETIRDDLIEALSEQAPRAATARRKRR